MRIAGLIPFTLTDYPGKVAGVVFTQGCNFRCPFCHNAELLPVDVPDSSLMPEEEIFSFLEQRRGKLEGIVITGGEPTVQPDLMPFLIKIRSLGFLAKLDTNGSRPDVLKKLFAERAVDFVAMDIKAPPAKYNQLAGVKAPLGKVLESIVLIAHSGVPHQFRTTVVPSLLSETDVQAIEAMVPQGSPYVRQRFRPEKTLAGIK